MKLDNMLPYRALWLGVALLSFTSRAAGSLSQMFCSSQNAADQSTFASNIFQSNGACYDQCKSSYAFAVVQYQSCWCSNYIPADTTDVGSCNQDCPGYPDEKCGNTRSGLFGYVPLPNAPSGTAEASSASSTSAPPSTPTAPSSTPQSTPEPRTSITSPTGPTSTTTSSTRTETPLAVVPVTSVIRTVISGAIVTQTVTSTPLAAGGAPQSPENPHGHGKEGPGGGAIAGIVLGLIAALALLGVAAFLLRRRRRTQDSEESGNGNSKQLGRNVSVLSKAGLLARSGATRQSMGERDHDDGIHNATGQNSVRHSMIVGPGAAEGVSPVSPLGSSNGSNHSRRMSKPMVYDQRLNPSALFANQEANGSRISMQDTQDYSRPLGVMNPDIRASFESRTSHA